jgi:menaquinone-dependent protoporphyrinogen IX oxidase
MGLVNFTKGAIRRLYGSAMAKLLIYVSKTGVTESVANDILKGTDESVDVFNLYESSPSSLDGYDTIIIGAPTYMGRAHKKMRKWVKTHSAILKTKKLYFYIVGADNQTDVDGVLKASYPEDLVDCATRKTHCGGAFRFDRMSFLSRFIIKTVSKNKEADPLEPTLDEQAIKAMIKALNNQ